jgi:hypothetical protein
MTAHTLALFTSLTVFLIGGAAEAQMPDYWPVNPRASATAQSDAQSSAEARDFSTRKSFDALDTNRHGYLTRKEAKQDDWAGRNFDRCNISHDGHLSEVEYSNCPE